MRVRLHREAELELQATAQWYEDRRPGLGEQFLGEAVDAFHAIERTPHRFARTRYRTSREVRRRILDRFPYAAVYEVREHECLVVAVAHLHRRATYWRDRLK